MKTLLVYASAGVGHKKAAEAVLSAYSEKQKENVVIKDILEYTTPFVKLSYPSSYLFAIKHTPLIWGMLFHLTNNRFFYRAIEPLKAFIERASSLAFRNYLVDEKFDVIISTHFFSSLVCSELKAKGIIKPKLITVITDYRLHSFWLSRQSDYFAVATEKTKEDLIARGIGAEKIKVTGIPVDVKFKEAKNTKVIREKLKLSDLKKTVLIMGGGYGVGPYEFFLKELASLDKDIQLLFVCGHNKKLYRHLAEIAGSYKHASVFGFVDNVDELMYVSDVLVSKAGGITVSEALATHTPMVIIKPIPGQELFNAEYLEHKGSARYFNHERPALGFLKELISNQALYAGMKQTAARIARPEAAEEIVELGRENRRTS